MISAKQGLDLLVLERLREDPACEALVDTLRTMDTLRAYADIDTEVGALMGVVADLLEGTAS